MMFLKLSKTTTQQMKKRVLMVLDMIAEVESNKNLVLLLLYSEGKSNISATFISQYYFKRPKTIRLNGKKNFSK